MLDSARAGGLSPFCMPPLVHVAAGLDGKRLCLLVFLVDRFTLLLYLVKVFSLGVS